VTAVAGSKGLSDTGRKRRRNEDAYVVQPPLFAVADGMGGAQAGEVASKLAAAALEDTDPGSLSGGERLVALIQEANRRVYERSNEDPAASGMGTTMTVALVEDGHVSIGHVGDSRAYRIRGGELEQLTEDHSLVAELMKSGKLSPEEAETHPQRSVITRALGTDPDVDVDVYSVPVEDGDLFLLCSDGLTTMVGEDVIRDVLERYRPDLDRAARELISEANRGGGEDNITVVVFEVATGADELEQTVQMSAAELPGGDEEDTLSGLEGVAPVDTMVVPAAEIEAFAARAPERARERDEAQQRLQRRARLQLVLTVVLLLAVGAGLLLWSLLH
jgi:serine/threonine protein phosphatase PrpC